MRFALAFNGTRGDIQPAVVIGSELQRRGHDVVVGAPPNLRDFVTAAGLDARPFGYDTRALMNSALVRDGWRTGGPRQRLAALRSIRDLGWSQAISDMPALAADADVVVTGFVTEQVVAPFAEQRDIPWVALHHAPIRPNPSYSPIPGAPLGLPPVVNALSWALAERTLSLLTHGRRRKLREQLGLAGTAVGPTFEIQAYDRVLCPELTEWPTSRPFVGFLNLTAEQRTRVGADELSDDLVRWIESGPAPVYFGFGSMPVRDPAALVSAIGTACARLRVRAIVSTGWSDIDAPASDDLRLVKSVDHDRLFPRCRAVVHHGGAGTTAAALRAGRPSVVCWVGSDQPFWGAQCERHGVGTVTRLQTLDADTLTAKLAVVLEPGYTERAQELSAGLTPPRRAVSECADVLEACR